MLYLFKLTWCPPLYPPIMNIRARVWNIRMSACIYKMTKKFRLDEISQNKKKFVIKMFHTKVIEFQQMHQTMIFLILSASMEELSKLTLKFLIEISIFLFNIVEIFSNHNNKTPFDKYFSRYELAKFKSDLDRPVRGRFLKLNFVESFIKEITSLSLDITNRLPGYRLSPRMWWELVGITSVSNILLSLYQIRDWDRIEI